MYIKIAHNFPSPDDLEFEVVERKGIGHPDTVADGIAETISIEYSRYCLQQFGVILHHNVDKVNVLGGLARIEWGSDDILHPIRVILNGRISTSFGAQQIPVDDICEAAATQFISAALPNLIPERHVRYIHEHTTFSRNPYWFKPRSVDDLPEYKFLSANDTSAVAGSFPLTLAEELTLGIEGSFYNEDQTPIYPECGQDIKIMVVRLGKNFRIRVCFPVILKYCPDVETYWAISERIFENVSNYISYQLSRGYSFHLELNTGKDPAKSQAREFYTVVGGSALDFGEEGLVGRGNNRSGIIPMFRTFSMEASHGKNPVYHVGKILGVVADQMSKQIHRITGCKNEVLLVAKNGDTLLRPSQVIVKTLRRIDKNKVREVVEEVLDRSDWTSQVVDSGILLPKTGNAILKAQNAEDPPL